MFFSAVTHPKVCVVRVFQYKSKSGLNVRSSFRDESNTSYFRLAANVVNFWVLQHLLKHVYVILYQQNMPRVRVRKTDRGLIQPDIYERAFLDISVRNISLRAAAKSHGICHVTLLRYCRRRAETSREKTRPPGYRSHSKVFSVDQERKLQAYIKRAADIYFGLSPKEVSLVATVKTLNMQLTHTALTQTILNAYQNMRFVYSLNIFFIFILIKFNIFVLSF